MTKKALIIEDNVTDASIIKDILTEAGIEVEVASTGKEGLEKALVVRPDIIILDLILPDIDGFEVCAKLKGDPRLSDTIVVVLSVRDAIKDVEKAFQLKADDYVIKPPDPTFLARKIKLYLGIRENGR
jgi:DNA-binding response OmpR family regulator